METVLHSVRGRDCAPEGASLVSRAGYDPQTLAFGGFQAINYEKTIPLDKLPASAPEYK
jgi:hypothetical protein